MKELLEECQARTDIKDRKGETAVHVAAKLDSPVVTQVSSSIAGPSTITVLLKRNPFKPRCCRCLDRPAALSTPLHLLSFTLPLSLRPGNVLQVLLRRQ